MISKITGDFQVFEVFLPVIRQHESRLGVEEEMAHRSANDFRSERITVWRYEKLFLANVATAVKSFFLKRLWISVVLTLISAGIGMYREGFSLWFFIYALAPPAILVFGALMCELVKAPTRLYNRRALELIQREKKTLGRIRELEATVKRFEDASPVVEFSGPFVVTSGSPRSPVTDVHAVFVNNPPEVRGGVDRTAKEVWAEMSVEDCKSFACRWCDEDKKGTREDVETDIPSNSMFWCSLLAMSVHSRLL